MSKAPINPSASNVTKACSSEPALDSTMASAQISLASNGKKATSIVCSSPGSRVNVVPVFKMVKDAACSPITDTKSTFNGSTPTERMVKVCTSCSPALKGEKVNTRGSTSISTPQLSSGSLISFNAFSAVHPTASNNPNQRICSSPLQVTISF